MIDTLVPPELPMPEQMRALNQSMVAAWHARRMREASRGIFIGNIAMAICLASTELVVMHLCSADRGTRPGSDGPSHSWAQDIGPFLALGLLGVYFAGLFFSLRWLKRHRYSNSVTVVDRNEEEARKAVTRPKRAIAILLGILIFLSLGTFGWIFAFRNMSNQAIVISLFIGPCMAAVFFIFRFVSFRFWEDLVFAGSAILAFVPMFFILRYDVSFLSFVSLGLVVAATASLQYRWIVWTRSLEKREAETDIMEARS